MKISICADHFEPGYRGGGCLRAVSHLVRSFSGEVALQIITRDRDLGATEAYGEAERAAVATELGCEIHYLPPGAAAFPAMRKAVEGFKPDILYLNSAFSPVFTLWPLLAYRRLDKGILLAPRGELLSGALATKGLKKNLFLALARAAGLYRGIHWHATCQQEAEAIASLRLGGRTIHLAGDLPGPPPPLSDAPMKESGQLDLLFLARLHPMKGLHRLLQWLPGVEGRLRLRIAGPEEDPSYAATCRELARTLPGRIEVAWLGPLRHEEALAEFSRAQAYVLPTETENHGYTIQEALACGCPVITSEGTPWKDLEAHGAGWTLPLESPEVWRGVVQSLTGMGAEAYLAQRVQVRRFGQETLEATAAMAATRAMFQSVMQGVGPR